MREYTEVCVCAHVHAHVLKKPSQGKYFQTFYLSLDAEKQQASGSKCSIPKSEIPAIIHGRSTAGARGNMSAPLSGQRRLTAPL